MEFIEQGLKALRGYLSHIHQNCCQDRDVNEYIDQICAFSQGNNLRPWGWRITHTPEYKSIMKFWNFKHQRYFILLLAANIGGICWDAAPAITWAVTRTKCEILLNILKSDDTLLEAMRVNTYDTAQIAIHQSIMIMSMLSKEDNSFKPMWTNTVIMIKEYLSTSKNYTQAEFALVAGGLMYQHNKLEKHSIILYMKQFFVVEDAVDAVNHINLKLFQDLGFIGSHSRVMLNIIGYNNVDLIQQHSEGGEKSMAN